MARKRQANATLTPCDPSGCFRVVQLTSPFYGSVVEADGPGYRFVCAWQEGSRQPRLDGTVAELGFKAQGPSASSGKQALTSAFDETENMA